MVRETRYLIVRNLPENCTEETIIEHFQRYGKIQSVKLQAAKDNDTDNTATVAFNDIKSAAKAHNAKNSIGKVTLRTDYWEGSTGTPALAITPVAGSSSVRSSTYSSANTPASRLVSTFSTWSKGTSDEDGSNTHDKVDISQTSAPGINTFVTASAALDKLSSTAFDLQRGRGRERIKQKKFGQKFEKSGSFGRHGTTTSTRSLEAARSQSEAAAAAAAVALSLSATPATTSGSSSSSGNTSGLNPIIVSDSKDMSSRDLKESTRESTSMSRPHSVASPSSRNSGVNRLNSQSRSVSHSRSRSRGSRSSSCRSRSSGTSQSTSPHRSHTSSTTRPQSMVGTSRLVNSEVKEAKRDDNDGERRPLGICVMGLPLRSTDSSLRDGLYHEYKKHGKVTTVQICGDGESRCAVVSFRKPEDASKALEASQGKRFFGAQIKVSSHEGVEVDDTDRGNDIDSLDEYHVKSTRTLFVGNLEKETTTQDLIDKFKQFGDIIDVDIKRQGASTAFAFVQYADIASVVSALRAMEGEHIGINKIKLGFGKSMPTCCVWMDCLPTDSNNRMLRAAMTRYGEVTYCCVDRTRSKGLVYFTSYEDAQRCVNDIKMRPHFMKKKLQIDFASRECQTDFLDRMETTGQLRANERPDESRVHKFRQQRSFDSFQEDGSDSTIKLQSLTRSDSTTKVQSLTTRPDSTTKVQSLTRSNSKIKLQSLTRSDSTIKLNLVIPRSPSTYGFNRTSSSFTTRNGRSNSGSTSYRRGRQCTEGTFPEENHTGSRRSRRQEEFNQTGQFYSGKGSTDDYDAVLREYGHSQRERRERDLSPRPSVDRRVDGQSRQSSRDHSLDRYDKDRTVEIYNSRDTSPGSDHNSYHSDRYRSSRDEKYSTREHYDDTKAEDNDHHVRVSRNASPHIHNHSSSLSHDSDYEHRGGSRSQSPPTPIQEDSSIHRIYYSDDCKRSVEIGDDYSTYSSSQKQKDSDELGSKAKMVSIHSSKLGAEVIKTAGKSRKRTHEESGLSDLSKMDAKLLRKSDKSVSVSEKGKVLSEKEKKLNYEVSRQMLKGRERTGSPGSSASHGDSENGSVSEGDLHHLHQEKHHILRKLRELNEEVVGTSEPDSPRSVAKVKSVAVKEALRLSGRSHEDRKGDDVLGKADAHRRTGAKVRGLDSRRESRNHISDDLNSAREDKSHVDEKDGSFGGHSDSDCGSDIKRTKKRRTDPSVDIVSVKDKGYRRTGSVDVSEDEDLDRKSDHSFRIHSSSVVKRVSCDSRVGSKSYSEPNKAVEVSSSDSGDLFKDGLSDQDHSVIKQPRSASKSNIFFPNRVWNERSPVGCFSPAYSEEHTQDSVTSGSLTEKSSKHLSSSPWQHSPPASLTGKDNSDGDYGYYKDFTIPGSVSPDDCLSDDSMGGELLQPPPGEPSVEERIRAIDEMLNMTTSNKSSDPSLLISVLSNKDIANNNDNTALYSKFRIRKREGVLDGGNGSLLTERKPEPSVIMQQVLSKKSILDQDFKRLEQMSEIYDLGSVKELSTPLKSEVVSPTLLDLKGELYLKPPLSPSLLLSSSSSSAHPATTSSSMLQPTITTSVAGSASSFAVLSASVLTTSTVSTPVTTCSIHTSTKPAAVDNSKRSKIKSSEIFEDVSERHTVCTNSLTLKQDVIVVSSSSSSSSLSSSSIPVFSNNSLSSSSLANSLSPSLTSSIAGSVQTESTTSVSQQSCKFFASPSLLPSSLLSPSVLSTFSISVPPTMHPKTNLQQSVLISPYTSSLSSSPLSATQSTSGVHVAAPFTQGPDKSQLTPTVGQEAPRLCSPSFTPENSRTSISSHMSGSRSPRVSTHTADKDDPQKTSNETDLKVSVFSEADSKTDELKANSVTPDIESPISVQSETSSIASVPLSSIDSKANPHVEEKISAIPSIVSPQSTNSLHNSGLNLFLKSSDSSKTESLSMELVSEKTVVDIISKGNESTNKKCNETHEAAEILVSRKTEFFPAGLTKTVMSVSSKDNPDKDLSYVTDISNSSKGQSGNCSSIHLSSDTDTTPALKAVPASANATPSTSMSAASTSRPPLDKSEKKASAKINSSYSKMSSGSAKSEALFAPDVKMEQTVKSSDTKSDVRHQSTKGTPNKSNSSCDKKSAKLTQKDGHEHKDLPSSKELDKRSESDHKSSVAQESVKKETAKIKDKRDQSKDGEKSKPKDKEETKKKGERKVSEKKVEKKNVAVKEEKKVEKKEDKKDRSSEKLKDSVKAVQAKHPKLEATGSKQDKKQKEKAKVANSKDKEKPGEKKIFAGLSCIGKLGTTTAAESKQESKTPAKADTKDSKSVKNESTAKDSTAKDSTIKDSTGKDSTAKDSTAKPEKECVQKTEIVVKSEQKTPKHKSDPKSANKIASDSKCDSKEGQSTTPAKKSSEGSKAKKEQDHEGTKSLGKQQSDKLQKLKQREEEKLKEKRRLKEQKEREEKEKEEREKQKKEKEERERREQEERERKEKEEKDRQKEKEEKERKEREKEERERQKEKEREEKERQKEKEREEKERKEKEKEERLKEEKERQKEREEKERKEREKEERERQKEKEEKERKEKDREEREKKEKEDKERIKKEKAERDKQKQKERDEKESLKEKEKLDKKLKEKEEKQKEKEKKEKEKKERKPEKKEKGKIIKDGKLKKEKEDRGKKQKDEKAKPDKDEKEKSNKEKEKAEKDDKKKVAPKKPKRNELAALLEHNDMIQMSFTSMYDRVKTQRNREPELQHKTEPAPKSSFDKFKQNRKKNGSKIKSSLYSFDTSSGNSDDDLLSDLSESEPTPKVEPAKETKAKKTKQIKRPHVSSSSSSSCEEDDDALLRASKLKDKKTDKFNEIFSSDSEDDNFQPPSSKLKASAKSKVKPVPKRRKNRDDSSDSMASRDDFVKPQAFSSVTDSLDDMDMSEEEDVKSKRKKTKVKPSKSVEHEERDSSIESVTKKTLRLDPDSSVESVPKKPLKVDKEENLVKKPKPDTKKATKTHETKPAKEENKSAVSEKKKGKSEIEKVDNKMEISNKSEARKTKSKVESDKSAGKPKTKVDSEKPKSKTEPLSKTELEKSKSKVESENKTKGESVTVPDTEKYKSKDDEKHKVSDDKPKAKDDEKVKTKNEDRPKMKDEEKAKSRDDDKHKVSDDKPKAKDDEKVKSKNEERPKMKDEEKAKSRDDDKHKSKVESESKSEPEKSKVKAELESKSDAEKTKSKAESDNKSEADKHLSKGETGSKSDSDKLKARAEPVSKSEKAKSSIEAENKSETEKPRTKIELESKHEEEKAKLKDKLSSESKSKSLAERKKKNEDKDESSVKKKKKKKYDPLIEEQLVNSLITKVYDKVERDKKERKKTKMSIFDSEPEDTLQSDTSSGILSSHDEKPSAKEVEDLEPVRPKLDSNKGDTNSDKHTDTKPSTDEVSQVLKKKHKKKKDKGEEQKAPVVKPKELIKKNQVETKEKKKTEIDLKQDKISKHEDHSEDEHLKPPKKKKKKEHGRDVDKEKEKPKKCGKSPQKKSEAEKSHTSGDEKDCSNLSEDKPSSQIVDEFTSFWGHPKPILIPKRLKDSKKSDDEKSKHKDESKTEVNSDKSETSDKVKEEPSEKLSHGDDKLLDVSPDVGKTPDSVTTPKMESEISDDFVVPISEAETTVVTEIASSVCESVSSIGGDSLVIHEETVSGEEMAIIPDETTVGSSIEIDDDDFPSLIIDEIPEKLEKKPVKKDKKLLKKQQEKERNDHMDEVIASVAMALSSDDEDDKTSLLIEPARPDQELLLSDVINQELKYGNKISSEHERKSNIFPDIIFPDKDKKEKPNITSPLGGAHKDRETKPSSGPTKKESEKKKDVHKIFGPLDEETKKRDEELLKTLAVLCDPNVDKPVVIEDIKREPTEEEIRQKEEAEKKKAEEERKKAEEEEKTRREKEEQAMKEASDEAARAVESLLEFQSGYDQESVDMDDDLPPLFIEPADKEPPPEAAPVSPSENKSDIVSIFSSQIPDKVTTNLDDKLLEKKPDKKGSTDQADSKLDPFNLFATPAQTVTPVQVFTSPRNSASGIREKTPEPITLTSPQRQIPLSPQMHSPHRLQFPPRPLHSPQHQAQSPQRPLMSPQFDLQSPQPHLQSPQRPPFMSKDTKIDTSFIVTSVDVPPTHTDMDISKGQQSQRRISTGLTAQPILEQSLRPTQVSPRRKSQEFPSELLILSSRRNTISVPEEAASVTHLDRRFPPLLGSDMIFSKERTHNNSSLPPPVSISLDHAPHDTNSQSPMQSLTIPPHQDSILLSPKKVSPGLQFKERAPDQTIFQPAPNKTTLQEPLPHFSKGPIHDQIFSQYPKGPSQDQLFCGTKAPTSEFFKANKSTVEPQILLHSKSTPPEKPTPSKVPEPAVVQQKNSAQELSLQHTKGPPHVLEHIPPHEKGLLMREPLFSPKVQPDNPFNYSDQNIDFLLNSPPRNNLGFPSFPPCPEVNIPAVAKQPDYSQDPLFIAVSEVSARAADKEPSQTRRNEGFPASYYQEPVPGPKAHQETVTVSLQQNFEDDKKGTRKRKRSNKKTTNEDRAAALAKQQAIEESVQANVDSIRKAFNAKTAAEKASMVGSDKKKTLDAYDFEAHIGQDMGGNVGILSADTAYSSYGETDTKPLRSRNERGRGRGYGTRRGRRGRGSTASVHEAPDALQRTDAPNHPASHFPSRVPSQDHLQSHIQQHFHRQQFPPSPQQQPTFQRQTSQPNQVSRPLPHFYQHSHPSPMSSENSSSLSAHDWQQKQVPHSYQHNQIQHQPLLQSQSKLPASKSDVLSPESNRQDLDLSYGESELIINLDDQPSSTEGKENQYNLSSDGEERGPVPSPSTPKSQRSTRARKQPDYKAIASGNVHAPVQSRPARSGGSPRGLGNGAQSPKNMSPRTRSTENISSSPVVKLEKLEVGRTTRSRREVGIGKGYGKDSVNETITPVTSFEDQKNKTTIDESRSVSKENIYEFVDNEHDQLLETSLRPVRARKKRVSENQDFQAQQPLPDYMPASPTSSSNSSLFVQEPRHVFETHVPEIKPAEESIKQAPLSNVDAIIEAVSKGNFGDSPEEDHSMDPPTPVVSEPEPVAAPPPTRSSRRSTEIKKEAELKEKAEKTFVIAEPPRFEGKEGGRKGPTVPPLRIKVAHGTKVEKSEEKHYVIERSKGASSEHENPPLAFTVKLSDSGTATIKPAGVAGNLTTSTPVTAAGGKNQTFTAGEVYKNDNGQKKDSSLGLFSGLPQNEQQNNEQDLNKFNIPNSQAQPWKTQDTITDETSVTRSIGAMHPKVAAKVQASQESQNNPAQVQTSVPQSLQQYPPSSTPSSIPSLSKSSPVTPATPHVLKHGWCSGLKQDAPQHQTTSSEQTPSSAYLPTYIQTVSQMPSSLSREPQLHQQPPSSVHQDTKQPPNAHSQPVLHSDRPGKPTKPVVMEMNTDRAPKLTTESQKHHQGSFGFVPHVPPAHSGQRGFIMPSDQPGGHHGPHFPNSSLLKSTPDTRPSKSPSIQSQPASKIGPEVRTQTPPVTPGAMLYAGVVSGQPHSLSPTSASPEGQVIERIQNPIRQPEASQAQPTISLHLPGSHHQDPTSRFMKDDVGQEGQAHMTGHNERTPSREMAMFQHILEQQRLQQHLIMAEVARTAAAQEAARNSTPDTARNIAANIAMRNALESSRNTPVTLEGGRKGPLPQSQPVGHSQPLNLTPQSDSRGGQTDSSRVTPKSTPPAPQSPFSMPYFDRKGDTGRLSATVPSSFMQPSPGGHREGLAPHLYPELSLANLTAHSPYMVGRLPLDPRIYGPGQQPPPHLMRDGVLPGSFSQAFPPGTRFPVLEHSDGKKGDSGHPEPPAPHMLRSPSPIQRQLQADALRQQLTRMPCDLPTRDSPVGFLQRYPVMWQGALALKNDNSYVQMHFIAGNRRLPNQALPQPMQNGALPPLRISQRMRLEHAQLEGVAKRMQCEDHYCILIAVACGRDQMDINQQTRALNEGFITYLLSKQAAGIVNVPLPGSEQVRFVVHIFPPCEFVDNSVAQQGSVILMEQLREVPHAVVIIATT